MARTLLGLSIRDDSWKIVEGYIESDSTLALAREARVHWFTRGSWPVMTAEMEATSHATNFALRSNGELFELDAEGLSWGTTDVKLERTPEGMTVRHSASRGMRALVAGYLRGKTFRARGPGSLVLFTTPPGICPRTRLAQHLCLHYVGPSIVILGAAAATVVGMLSIME